MKHLRGYLCLLLTLCVFISSFGISAYSAEDETNDSNESIYGVYVDDYTVTLPECVPKANSTPLSSYDPRELNYVTDVKNQYSLKTCWAFASTAVMEQSVLYQTGLKYSYSEEALRYAASNQLKKDLGTGTGPDYGYYNRDADRGGDTHIGFSYLTKRNNPVTSDTEHKDTLSWLAPNLCDEVPYDNTPQRFVWPNNLNTSYSNAYAAETRFIDMGEVKDAILENGAVYFIFTSDQTSGLNRSTGAFYTKSYDESSLHAVACVGWNDNYSKTNFLSTNQPKNNGAWLVKNSWGTSGGENGYYWISYDDASICKDISPATINEVAPVSKNEYMLSYDLIPVTGVLSYVNDQGDPLGDDTNSICMANVYDVTNSNLAQDYGTVSQVTFYSSNVGSDYKIYIVPFTTENVVMPADSGFGSIQASGTVDYEGYITAKFDTPYSFNSNVKKLAVIVEFSDSNIDTDSFDLNIEKRDYPYAPRIYAGESYVYYGGEWSDVASNEALVNRGNFCIRPMLVRRQSVAQDSTLSLYEKRFEGSDISVNVNLNGNKLYKITENGTTLLYQDQNFTRTRNASSDTETIKFSSDYLNTLSKTSDTNIVFTFTDGADQTLTIHPPLAILQSVSIGGNIASGETLTAVVGTNVSELTNPDVYYRWQTSEDKSTWNTVGYNQTYTLTQNDMFKYVRAYVVAKNNGNVQYPKTVYSTASATKVVKYGDANLDGSVSVKDSTLVQKFVVGSETPTAEQFIASDVDGDGAITIKDANYISKYVVGSISKFPVQS